MATSNCTTCGHQSWDEMSYRVLVSVVLLSIVSLTYLNSFFKKNVVSLLHASVFVLTAHLFFVGYKNNLTMFYTWAVTISLLFCVPFLFTFKARLTYSAYVVLLSTFTALNTNGVLPPLLYVMANATIVSFSVVESYMRERLTNELRQKEKQIILASKLTALGEMVGGLAHEINNPLMAIDSKVSVLQRLIEKESFDPTLARKNIESIRVLVSKAANTIRVVKGLSGDSGDELPALIDVKKTVNDVFDLCRENCIKQSIECSIDDRTTKPTIECNESALSQILVNLIDNSIDALNLQNGPKWIRCVISEEFDHLAIRVVDSGKKIESSVAEKMMQPFFTTKPVGLGMGMGLSLAVKMAQSLRGELFYEPKEKNTTFVVRLPKSQVDLSKLSA